MSQHQDRSRNALAKSIQAAFKSWCEDLKADQAQFMSEKILLPGKCWEGVGRESFFCRAMETHIVILQIFEKKLSYSKTQDVVKSALYLFQTSSNGFSALL